MSKAAELAALIGSQTALSNRSLIINGAMQVAQRGTSTASVTTGNIYTACDRWSNSGNTFGTFTLSQSTEAPAGFANSFKYDCTTANASLSANSHLGLVQKFEGQNLQKLEKSTSTAKPITVSFWVKSNKTGDYTLEVDDRDNTRAFSKKYTIDSADTWEFKSLTFVGDTTGALDNDNAHSFSCSWWLANGSDWTSGTFTTGWEARTKANRVTPNQVNLADSTSNEWYMTGVQFEVGEQATPFEHRSYADELQTCKRFYQRWDATASDATSDKPIGAGVWYTSTQILAMFNYDEMRVAPTFTGSSTGFVKAYGGGFAETRTGGNGIDTIGTKAARFNFTCGARTAGHGTMIQMDANGESLELDAEL